MTPNMRAIDEAMAAVEAEYAKGQAGEVCLWDQTVWADERGCDTAGCLFGWRAFLDGATFSHGEDGTTLRLPDGSTRDPLSYGKDRFGLDWFSADILAGGGNSIEDLRRLVAVLRVRGRITAWDEAAPEAAEVAS